MRIGQGPSSLSLHLEGYEFPKRPGNRWDDNWLQVRLEASHPEGTWHVTEPMLLTWEAGKLSKWVENLARREPPAERRLEFLEPTLAIEHVATRGEWVTLRLCFDLEAVPPWWERRGEPFRMIVTTSPAESRAAAADLRTELAHFPQR